MPAGLPIVAILLVSLLASCTGREGLSRGAVTLNREVAAAHDQMLLLNILRRSRGEPMHFTAISTIRDRARVNGSVSLNLPFGGAAVPDYSASPSVSTQQGPGFDVVSLENQEFYQGLSLPVSVRTVDRYFRRAPSRELVLLLLVDEIEIDGRSHRNDPAAPASFAGFQQAARRLLAEGLTTERIDLARRVGPPLEGPTPPNASDLVSLHGEGLVVAEISPGSNATRRFQVAQLVPDARFCFASPTHPLFRSGACSRPTGASAPRFDASDPRAFSAGERGTAVLDAGSLGRIRVELRSVAEMIDYLGKLVRLDDSGIANRANGPQGPRPIFVVEPAPAVADGATSVLYRGSRYAVPADAEGGFSSEVLTILSELVAEAQSVQDLPSGNVTIIGD